MLFLRLFILFGLFASAFMTMASTPVAGKVTKQPAPSWVKSITPNLPQEIPVKDISNGTYYLLADEQNRVTENNAQAFRHYAELIVNQKGVQQSGQVSVTFDPIYESVVFHRLSIIRDGEVLDKLAASDIKLISVEPEFDKLIYNGRQSAKIIIDDVRVNDVLEYSYSRIGRNPVYQGLYNYRPYVSWSVPLHQQYVSVLWGKEAPLYVSTSDENFKISESTSTDDSGKSYALFEFGRIDGEYHDYNSQTPDWFEPYQRLYFTQSKSWGEIVDWALPMYQAAFSDNQNSALNQLVLDIQLAHNTPQQQVAAALKVVQDDVRYFGIEMGRNSHQPSHASETLERRYGDCKDKVVLFVSILKSLGIEAYPALVNTDDGRGLLNVPPGVGSFDHVIAQVAMGDKHYWFDPTLSFQAGQVDDIFQPNYDVALLIKPGSNQLISMNESERKVGWFVKETFDITAGGGKPAQLMINSQYRGDVADRHRRRVAEDGLAELEKDYLNFYRDYYAQTETITPIALSQDAATGQVNLTEHYQLNDFWQDQGKGRFDGEFYAHSIRGYLKKPSQLKRTSPYYLSHPVHVKQQIKVLIGEDGWEFNKDSLKQDNDFYYFNYQLNFDEQARELTIDYEYRSKVGFVSVEDIEAYNAQRETARKETYYSISDYKDTSANTSNNSDFTSAEQLISLAVITVFFVGYGVIMMAWLIDGSEYNRKPQTFLYPVSFTKVLVLSLLTLGFYPSYWMYRQWQAVKERTGESLSPFIRAVFGVLWFIPLWLRIREIDNHQMKLSFPKLLSVILALMMYVLFWIAAWVSYYDYYWLITPAIMAIALLPMVAAINSVNKEHAEEFAFNNRWLPRHLAMLALFLPSVVYAAAQWSNFLPPQRVVAADALWSHDIQFMRRNAVLTGDEVPSLFYSDALFDMSNDGNGFTDDGVFSYWFDAQKNFNVERAAFSDIKTIDFKPGEGSLNATITVTRFDDSNFELYVPKAGGDDEYFYQQLNAQWLRTKPSASE